MKSLWPLLLLLGCASAPSAYEVRSSAAERAYAHGRYREAAEHWLSAERSAARDVDREEARLRAAQSFERAGVHGAARAQYQRVASAQTRRGDRAAYELAIAAFDADPSSGSRQLTRYVDERPNSAHAPRAAARLKNWLLETGGVDAAIAWLTATLERHSTTELAQHVHFMVAELLERRGDLSAARDRYLAIAQRYPYPEGALWDDAHFRASLLEERLGRYRAAVLHLERMLEQRESSAFVGSYERPRFDDARYRIAELYRDRLSRPDQARLHFQRLWREHPDSLLRDDAAWQAARLAHAGGDRAGACRTLEQLVDGAPTSRYVACAPLLCPALASPERGRLCRDYIRRELARPDR